MSGHIEAISVNHNTSPYMELMLRSLFGRHGPELGLEVTVADNASMDDTTGLLAYAEHMGIPIVPSGFTTNSSHNSHGEILSRFVLEHPDCSHYLFLDADVCFVEDNTLVVMREELDATRDAFGIVARLSWDGIAEIPEEVRRPRRDARYLQAHDPRDAHPRVQAPDLLAHGLAFLLRVV